MTDIRWATRAFSSDDRSAAYALYDDYYAGEQPLAFSTPKFETAFGELFEAFAYNRCANVVQALTDRLRIRGFDADKARIRKEAARVWEENHMRVVEGQVNREAFTAGDGYVIVERDPDTGDVHMWPQDAEQIRVMYDPHVPGKRVAAAKQWTIKGGTRLNLYTPGQLRKYYRAGEHGGGSFEPFKAPGEPWPIRLAVPDEVPVFHFANDAPINSYGTSELANVIPIQDALNKSLMDLLVAMEFAAFPQRYMIDVDVEGDDEEAAVAKFVAGIDQLLTLYSTGDGKQPTLGEFGAANIQQYERIVELFDKLIARVAKVPPHYLTLPGQPPSGESLRVAEAPFVAKIEERQRSFGAVWSDALRYALRLKGIPVEAGAIRIQYEDAAPIGVTERLDMLKTKVRDLGMPLITALREDGYTPDRIALLLEDMKADAAAIKAAQAATPDDEERDAA